MTGDQTATVFDRLVRVQILLWNAVDARLRDEHDLPLTWFEPMRVVARGGKVRVHDIAAELLITEGGVSKLLDRIQAAGYLSRRLHPQDRRSSQIVLTPAGKQILAAAEVTFDAELAARLGAILTEDELATLDTTLELLRATNLDTDTRGRA